jgi:hypothetical protein
MGGLVRGMDGIVSSASRHPQNNKKWTIYKLSSGRKETKKIRQTEYILERTMLSECLLKWSKIIKRAEHLFLLCLPDQELAAPTKS